MKRIITLFCSLLIAAASFLPLATLRASALSDNEIANPSAETVSPTNSSLPDGWQQGKWGANTTTFSYDTTGHTGSHSTSVQMSSYTSGDAKWYFSPVAVTAGAQYTFTDYYQASVPTSLVAQFDNGSGVYTYVDLGSVAASTAWAQASATATAPAGAKNVTIFHMLSAVGSLRIDDAAFGPATAPAPDPTPASGNLVPNASVETPSSANANLPQSWQSGGWGANTTTYGYVSGGAQDGTRSLQVQTTAYTSGDAKWYFTPQAVTAGSSYMFSDYYKASIATDVVAQFDDGSGHYSYLDLGAAPASTSWKQYSASFAVPSGQKNVTVFHLLSGVGVLQTDNYSLAAVTVPTVAITSPQAGATVSGSVQLAASASDASGIKSVQFKVDGANVGNALTAAPYQTAWNTAALGNGAHSITAVATNTAGVSTTSPAVNVTVANAVSGNMVPNPSVETPTPGNTKTPQAWQTSSWGTNTTSFTYLASGAHTGSRALKVQTTAYTSGDAKWYFTPVAVDASQLYDFSDYYQATGKSYVVADFTMSDGTDQYVTLGTLQAASAWTKFEEQFSVPQGAKTVTVFHLISNVGSVTTDDYSLQSYTPVGFNRPIVSLTFDDAWASVYTNGLPILQKYGFVSTQYLLTGKTGDSAYMTPAMMLAFKNAGHEIASHTVTHPDLTTVSSTQLTRELANSKTTLQQWTGATVTDFASPYGSVNATVITQVKKYYASQRGVVAGFNSKNFFNPYDIKVQDIESNTSLAQLQAWIDQAKATHTWLVLVYHQIDTDPAAGDYNTPPADFDAQLNAIKNSNVAVETVTQALAELRAQL